MRQSKFSPEEGRRVSFREKACFVCGIQNPSGLKLEFEYDEAYHKATARYTFSDSHQGWDGVVHGGILAAVLDDAMAHAILTYDKMGITTRITVTYRDAVMVGEMIQIEGIVLEVRNRIARAEAVMFSVSCDESERIMKCKAEGIYYLDSESE